MKQRSSCLHCSTKRKNYTPFVLQYLANIVIEEYETKGNFVYRVARIITKMETGKEFQIYRDWKVDGNRQLGIFQVAPVPPVGAYEGSSF